MKLEYSISSLFLIAVSTALVARVDSAASKVPAVLVKIGSENATSLNATTTTLGPLNVTEETTTTEVPTTTELPGAEMVNITEVVTSTSTAAPNERSGRHFGKDKEEGEGYRGGYPPYPMPYPYPVPQASPCGYPPYFGRKRR